MAVFVTGATGFIGAKLCHELAQREESVVAFCRKHPQEKSTVEALTHPAIRIVRGDVKNLGSVIEAIRGCKSCIHLAGLARQWSRRSRDFYDVNVGGTRNVLEAAISSRVERFVFVSTAGVYGPSRNKDPIVESSPIPAALGTDYERTKRMAELLVLETVERYGLNACVVCPTRVFGPGILTESNSVTKIMADYLRGKWWIMPGDGSAIGNYVCVHDVVHGLIQALKLGHAGQRYILGGENLSYRQWFALLAQHSGVQRSLIPLPYPIAAAYAQFHLLLASLFGIPPQLTPAFARKYYLDSRFDCSQTRLDLHYKPARIADAIDATIHWLRENEAS